MSPIRATASPLSSHDRREPSWPRDVEVDELLGDQAIDLREILVEEVELPQARAHGQPLVDRQIGSASHHRVSTLKSPSSADALEAALQHRGDPRSGSDAGQKAAEEYLAILT